MSDAPQTVADVVLMPEVLGRVLSEKGLELEWSAVMDREVLAGSSRAGAMAAAFDALLPKFERSTVFKRHQKRIEDFIKICRKKAAAIPRREPARPAAAVSSGGEALPPAEEEGGLQVLGWEEAREAAGDAVDLRGDVEWVYQQFNRCVLRRNGRTVLDFRKATAKPPSAGALGLLKWASGHERDFFRDMVPKYLGKARDEGDGEIARRERRAIGQLRQRLAGLLEEFRAERATAP